MHQNIDFFGDVHGRASTLERLLQKLGYRRHAGAWRASGRLAVFVGDLVDRGPEQFRTVDIVRRMCDAGSARCVMGNHEHSAIGWVTPDPNKPGEFCRPHRAFNERMHEAFLREGALNPTLYAELIDWLKTLPPVLELSGVRVAHACWDERHVPTISAHCGPDGSFTPEGLLASLTKGTDVFKSFEVVAKGPEAKLPLGKSYVDAMGKERHEVRIAWWQAQRALRDVALPMPGMRLQDLPDVVLPESSYPKISDQHLQFIGHYWMQGAPAPLRSNLASVDYSGSAPAPLTAYQWRGEPVLSADNFVQEFDA